MMKKIFLFAFAFLLWGCGDADVDTTEDFNEEVIIEDAATDNLLDDLNTGKSVLKIVEFFDYSCPHCRTMQASLASLQQELGDKIEIESKPLVVYESSRGAALAAECARDQREWDGFHQSLFALQGKFNEQTIPALVHDLGLDKELFSACIASGSKKKVLEQYEEEAKSHDVDGTPSFVINGESVITGAYPPKIFEMMIRNMAKNN